MRLDALDKGVVVAVMLSGMKKIGCHSSMDRGVSEQVERNPVVKSITVLAMWFVCCIVA